MVPPPKSPPPCRGTQRKVGSTDGAMRSLAVAVLLLAVLAQVTNAIYADQAGELDWSMENLGRVIAVAYGGGDKARGPTRSTFVATDGRSRAVARLDSKSGAIKWRHVFAQGDDIDAIELTNYGLLTISSGGKHVRMWDAAEGGLVWDNVAHPGNVLASSGHTVLVGDDRAVVISSHSAAFVSLKDGFMSWKASLASAFDKIDSIVLSSDSATVFVVGHASSNILLVSIDVTTGESTSTHPAVVGDSVTLRNSETGEAALIAISSTQIKTQSLESNAKVTTWESPKTGTQVTLVGFEPDMKHALVVRLKSGERLLARLSSSLTIESSTMIPGDGLVVESPTDDAVFHVSAAPSSGVTSKMYSFASRLDPVEWKAPADVKLHGGDVSNAYPCCMPRKKDPSAVGCRMLLVMKDDGLIMTSNEDEATESESNALWTREEALANIKEVHWITPAETDIEKQPLKGIPSFVEDLKHDFERLRHALQHVVSLSSSLFDMNYSRSLDSRGRKEPVNAHFFGFSKYIVLLTESGRLFAIRAETNTIAWSIFVGPDYQLFVTRDHPALGAGAELLLVSSTSKLLWIDGDNGREIEAKEHSLDNAWVVLLPKRKHTLDEDASLRRSVALISQHTLEVTILPKGAPGVTYTEAENFYFSRHNRDQSAFEGYTIEKSPNGSYSARQVWSLAIPHDQELKVISHQRDNAVIDSSVTITGDDSLLLKYLNPHMFGIVTQGTELWESEQKAAPVLHATLVDAVTGRVIHRVRHIHGSGPVQMVQSENWVVYSYWNTKEKRTEVVSLALFDGAVGSHSLNLWKRPAWSEQRSSYDPRAPFVLQKSFIFPSRIQTLGVTVTSRGITPQYVLVGMESGQIFKLNKALIDPRQPEKPPTPEEQNEGLHQYSPSIPLYNMLTAMVTYNKSVASIKSIATTPVELESTTLLFAHGLDNFYARLAPAKAFDVLPPDFNYELLVLLCLGFFGITYGLKTLSMRKTMNEAWK